MRRTITILSVAALAVSAVAAPLSVNNRVERNRITRSALKLERQSMDATKLNAGMARSARGGFVNGNAVMTNDLTKLNDLKADSRKAPAKADEDPVVPEVIVDQPEGTLSVYSRSGDALTNFFGYIMSTTQNGYSLDIVTAPDSKTLYLKDFVSPAAADTWVKADVTDNGFKVSMGQCILYDEGYGYGLKVAVGKRTFVEENGEQYVSYEYCDSIPEVKFIKGDDGSYKIEDAFMSEERNPELIVALFYTDDNSWSAYSDWNTIYTPFTDTVTEFPAGVQTEDYVLESIDTEMEEKTRRLVKVGFKDDQVYISALNGNEPDAVATGTLKDGKVSIAADQYIGLKYGMFVYLTPATYVLDTYYDEYYEEEVTTVTYTSAESFVFNFDAEKKTLTPEPKTSLLLNGGKASTSLSVLEAMDDPELYQFKEVEAVPATPSIVEFGDYFDEVGYTGISCDVPTEDVDGNFINPEKLSYIIWNRIDDEEMEYVFHADEYVDIPKLGVDELTEVPYNFESEDFMGETGIATGAYAIYFFEAAPDAIGIQSIYKGAGVRTASPISWYDTSAVKGIEADSNAVPVAVYSLDGIRRQATEQGLNIVRMSDGSVKKVIVRK